MRPAGPADPAFADELLRGRHHVPHEDKRTFKACTAVHPWRHRICAHSRQYNSCEEFHAERYRHLIRERSEFDSPITLQTLRMVGEICDSSSDPHAQ